MEFRRGTKILAEKAVSYLCRAKKRVKVKKRTRFIAFSPADFDSLADASKKVTVKVLGAWPGSATERGSSSLEWSERVGITFRRIDLGGGPWLVPLASSPPWR